MTNPSDFSPDFSVITSLDDLDRLRQIALVIKNDSSVSSPSAAAATGSPAAGGGATAGGGGDDTNTAGADTTTTATTAAASSTNSTTTPDRTIFALPRAQAMLQLGVAKKQLGEAGSGDLVEVCLRQLSGNSAAGEVQTTMRGMQLCIEYMGIHSRMQFPPIPRPLKLHLRDYLQGDDREFVYGKLISGGGGGDSSAVEQSQEQNNDALFETFVAANILEFRPLVELCSAAVAQVLTGRSVGQMRQLLGVESDYTDEEEREISEANKQMFPQEAHRF